MVAICFAVLWAFKNSMLLRLAGDVKSELCLVQGKSVTILVDADFAVSYGDGCLKLFREIG